MPLSTPFVMSHTTRKLFKFAQKIAGTDEPVLLIGESGTGKEILARWIHAHSPRLHRPFLPLNCTALPEHLVASELFGYVEGAFTDARTSKKGLLESAEGGTVFFDEIGDLPLSIQVQLFRALETREILPLGARKPRQIDFRLISATNQNLDEKMEQGLFRKDLYFRIAVFVIHIPPLRERKEEIPELVQFFLKNLGVHARVHREVFDLFEQYDWPGNIRELRNIIHYAAVLCDGDEMTKDHLPDWFIERVLHKIQKPSFDIRELKHIFRSLYIQQAIECEGEKNPELLKKLGISRATFYRILQETRKKGKKT